MWANLILTSSNCCCLGFGPVLREFDVYEDSPSFIDSDLDLMLKGTSQALGKAMVIVKGTQPKVTAKSTCRTSESYSFE